MSRDQSPELAVSMPDPALPSPGAQLRQARELRGESVGEVAFALKLSPRQVVALESDDFVALPGMPFVRGFLRNYARYLALDPAPLLDAVQRLAGESAVDLSPIKNAEGELPSGRGQRLGSAPVGWIVVLLSLLVLAGWYFDWFRTQPQHIESALDTPLMDSVPAEPIGGVPIQSAERVSGNEMAQARVIEDAATVAASAAGATSSAATEPLPQDTLPAAREASAPALEPVVQAAPTVNDLPVAAAAEEVRSPVGAERQLAFRFGAESWIEVRDASGAIIYSGVNRAGSTRMVQGRPPFALVIGNAANVSLEFEGKPVELAAHTKVSVARLTVQ